MILKGNQRGGAKDLALHLMKEENDHIEVHELRGFVSDTLMGALNEAYAISRGTRCTQFLYSLSLNPPTNEKVSTADFEDAIERAEQRLHLTGQPRAIVFHEKYGRRHAHVVWSRIDIERMKAVQMYYDRTRLKSLSRELFLEHGWTMPEGLAQSAKRNPKNFTLEEWQRAKRLGKDPEMARAAIQDAWAISDSRYAFLHALEERGFLLAKGDKAAFVAVDVHGEVYQIARMLPKEIKVKDVRAKVGDEGGLPSVAKVKEQTSQGMLQALDRFKVEVDEIQAAQSHAFTFRRNTLVGRQTYERQSLKEAQERRQFTEAKARQERFRGGFKGLWDRMNGTYKRIRIFNEQEALQALQRDQKERDELIFKHLDQRKQLDIFKLQIRRDHTRQRQDLEQDRKTYLKLPDHIVEPRRRTRRRDRTHDPGPEP